MVWSYPAVLLVSGSPVNWVTVEPSWSWTSRFSASAQATNSWQDTTGDARESPEPEFGQMSIELVSGGGVIFAGTLTTNGVGEPQR